MTAVRLAAFSVLLSGMLRAGERSSVNYTIVAESVDAGGARATSANYSTDGSAGGVVGISTVVAPDETAKHGYVGQLYEPVGLQLAASPPTVDEGATRLVTAEAVLDDETTLSGSLTGILWSVVAGPIASIDTDGLTTAGLVYQDTTGTIQGSYFGFVAPLDLTVTDVDPDNFGSYAGDGIDDDWQIGFFGEDNLAAAPSADPDGDEQDNRFEFLALVDPTDANSFFCSELRPGRIIAFSPISPLRTYSVLSSPDLTPANFAPLDSSSVSDSGGERAVTDTSGAPGNRRFYRIDLSK